MPTKCVLAIFSTKYKNNNKLKKNFLLSKSNIMQIIMYVMTYGTLQFFTNLHRYKFKIYFKISKAPAPRNIILYDLNIFQETFNFNDLKR